MTLFFEIKFIINGNEINGQINYDIYLNENFYLIKINKIPPKKYNNGVTIKISKSIVELFSIISP